MIKGQGSAFVPQEPSSNTINNMVENVDPVPLPQRAGWIEGLDPTGKIHPALCLPLPPGVGQSCKGGPSNLIFEKTWAFGPTSGLG